MQAHSAATSGSSSNDAARWTPEDELRARSHNRDFETVKYARGSYLGSGGSATVYKVCRVSDGKIFAGKASRALLEMKKEAAVLQSLNHDHILKLIEWHQEFGHPATTLLVTELCPYKSLQERIDRATPNMAKAEIIRVVIQISDALAYLHDEKHLFHTDIKPRNILIRSFDPIDVVLADCADVKSLGDNYCARGTPDGSKRSLRGTPQYYSPEILQHGRQYGTGDDVWALGVTLVGMLAQWPPLCRPGMEAKDEVRKWPHRCQNHVQKLLALNPQHGLVKMLAGMMAWEVDERLTAKACAAEARALPLESGPDGANHNLEIKAPEDFAPISFW